MVLPSNMSPTVRHSGLAGGPPTQNQTLSQFIHETSKTSNTVRWWILPLIVDKDKIGPSMHSAVPKS